MFGPSYRHIGPQLLSKINFWGNFPVHNCEKVQFEKVQNTF